MMVKASEKTLKIELVDAMWVKLERLANELSQVCPPAHGHSEMESLVASLLAFAHGGLSHPNSRLGEWLDLCFGKATVERASLEQRIGR
ncbi:hypothetical protein Enr13x_37880 [Stieleria neptunia]|uniref:Uncharacterized protein n=1 Tax=Stieleria neptunia TaxID=2527979 RepID=A0A518HSX8_9BACT|nr:hypothetical protein [Stieleria neptunia]QDV43928.1 hypothetical protein Enr13x_37880 [Stieleria neptunia]